MITFTPLLLPVNAVASILSTDYASLFVRLSQRTAVLSLNVIKWVKLAVAIFHTPRSRVSSEAALFSASQELQWRCCVFLLGDFANLRKVSIGFIMSVSVCLFLRM